MEPEKNHGSHLKNVSHYSYIIYLVPKYIVGIDALSNWKTSPHWLPNEQIFFNDKDYHILN